MKADPSEIIMPQVNVSSVVSGVGMYVPERVIPNSHFSAYLETSDEWIRDRTGISERRWAEPGVSTSELALEASKIALANAGLTSADIDGIIFATVTPDFIFPSTACVLQGKLAIKQGFAFDVNAVCSGFLYALSIANSMIASGHAKNILVVGAELFSRLINPNDRSTCVLFGDGAGALVLSSVGSTPSGNSTTHGSGDSLRGIYSSQLFSDGSQGEILCVPMGTAKPATPASIAAGEHYLTMAGREVFKLAVRSLVEASESILATSGFSVQDVDYFISHQANKRILSAMAKQLGVADEKVLSNVETYGNTSAASLPILLAEASAKGTLKQGDLVLLSAFGGGVTWGTALLRW